MSDVDHNPFITPSPEAVQPDAESQVSQEAPASMPHSGNLGLEHPVQEFDKTPLQKAIDEKRITVPESPALLAEPTPEPTPKKANRGAKIFGAIAAVAAIGGGAFALGSRSGGNETETAERPAATAAPSPAAQTETDPGAPVIVPAPAAEAPAPAEPTTGNNEAAPSLTLYNEYLPSITDFPFYDTITEDSMKVYESPELMAAVDKYGLGFVTLGYESYYQDGPMVGDFAWWTLYPYKYVDTSRLGTEVTLNETVLKELAPVYMHNYVMAYNTFNHLKILGSDIEGNDGGVSGFPDVLMLPTEETYLRQPQITVNGNTATMVFAEVPIDVAEVYMIRPLNPPVGIPGGTYPEDWTMKSLNLEIDLTTGGITDYSHLAEKNP